MDQQERDIWAWAELLVTLLSGVAIPLVLGYFSYQFRVHHQQARNTDRVRHSVEMLASDNWRERFMGIRFLWHYCQENERYPTALISSLVSTMHTEPNPTVYREANKLFGEMTAPSGACHVSFDQHSPSGRHAKGRRRLYLHTQTVKQQSVADRIRDALSRKSLNVIGVGRSMGGPDESELRYFDPRASDVARTIARRVEQVTDADLHVRNFTARSDTIPNHFELWLAPPSVEE